MSEKQGYYSLVQYSEYPERLEFVNIGVVLFSGMHPHVSFKFVDTPNKVNKAFGVQLGVHFADIKSSLESRFKHDFSNSWEIEGIRSFVKMRAGKVRLTDPKSILVNADDVVDVIFQELVGYNPVKKRGLQARTKLRNAFIAKGVEEFLDKPDPLTLPQGVTIKPEYGYQNGVYNVIAPLSLRGNPDYAIKSVGGYAAEGKWLFDATKGSDQKQLNVVGDLESQPRRFIDAVERLFGDNNVKFYDMEKLNPLVKDIKLNAIP